MKVFVVMQGYQGEHVRFLAVAASLKVAKEICEVQYNRLIPPDEPSIQPLVWRRIRDGWTADGAWSDYYFIYEEELLTTPKET
jgi:hypothetical protein